MKTKVIEFRYPESQFGKRDIVLRNPMGKGELKLIEWLKEMARKEKISEKPIITDPPQLMYRRRKKVEDFKCPVCGSLIAVSEEEKENISQIEKLVGQMKELGYDAKIKHLCNACCQQGEFPYWIVTLFYIRLEGMLFYHASISNRIKEYENVLSFLRKDEHYLSKYNVEVIHKMLGITFPRLAVLINDNCKIIPKWTNGYEYGEDIDSYSLFNLYPYFNLKYRKIDFEASRELNLFFRTYQPMLTFFFLKLDENYISDYSEMIRTAKEHNSMVLCIIDDLSFIEKDSFLTIKKEFTLSYLIHYCKEFIKRIDFDFILFDFDFILSIDWKSSDIEMIKYYFRAKFDHINEMVEKVEQLLLKIQNDNDFESVINNIKAVLKDKESIMNDLNNFIEK